MNGTWIDKVRVDQGMEMFCYLDKVTMERDFQRSLSSKYLVGKVLGEGTTSLVRLGYRRDDFKKFALKMINTRSWPSKYSALMDMIAEVNVLGDIQHPCITVVHDLSSLSQGCAESLRKSIQYEGRRHGTRKRAR